ncbi:hypothetical protein GOEFS_109_00150 [Gordonia effusa NBRC 100432]|uniref:Uncharacterized protein n=1 Tax=Gordonia effusa NBRC 100432 TaxID=1077974 RepID=H0R5B9_9ACTN|nr:hypothetical protein [Gordonia effusa]GAB20270.1 hypothetical protein GOEFS_109_00150 [Gordonia effusa NBRC 100432]
MSSNGNVPNPGVLSEMRESDKQLKVGDTVRETWSGIEGELLAIEGDVVTVNWPAGPRPSRLGWLVSVTRSNRSTAAE